MGYTTEAATTEAEMQREMQGVKLRGAHTAWNVSRSWQQQLAGPQKPCCSNIYQIYSSSPISDHSVGAVYTAK